MKECPSCGATLFPKQRACPHCGAHAVARRGAIGWSILIGGILMLAAGLFLCFAVLSFSTVAQVAVGLAMVLFGLRFRQDRWDS